MGQRVVIVDDASDRTALMAEALRGCGYRVVMLQAQTSDELLAGLCRIRPDILVYGEEVVIELDSDDGARLLREMAPRVQEAEFHAG